MFGFESTHPKNVDLLLGNKKNDREGLWICSILEELFRREHGTRKSHLMIQITKLLGGLLTAGTFSECFQRSGFTRDRNVQREV